MIDDQKNMYEVLCTFTLQLVKMIDESYEVVVSTCYRSALRNWQFQMSKDGVTWTTLMTHENDTSLNEPGSTMTWPLEIDGEEKQGLQDTPAK